MRIWYLNTANQLPGDGWRQSRSAIVCDLLAARGHSVIWWTSNFSHHTKTFRADGWKDVVVRPGLTVRLVPTVGYTRNVGAGRILADIVYSWRVLRAASWEPSPDCIIAWDGPLGSSFVGARLARRLGAALVLDVFDLMPELFVLVLPKFLKRWQRLIFGPLYALRRYSRRRADAIVALSDDYLENALLDSPGSRERPHAVIFNGIDVAAFREEGVPPCELEALKREKSKKPGDLWAIFAGTLGNNYDVVAMLHAAELLSQRPGSCHIKLLVAGDGPLRPMVTEFIASRKLVNVQYLGRLPPSDLVRFYQVSDVGLCAYGPDSNVAMPDKGYDYMSLGLAIVNSLRGEFERLVAARQMGLQYRAGDPRSLADALTELSRDPSRLDRMRANAHAAALQFDKHVQYPRFVEVVESTNR